MILEEIKNWFCPHCSDEKSHYSDDVACEKIILFRLGCNSCCEEVESEYRMIFKAFLCEECYDNNT